MKSVLVDCDDAQVPLDLQGQAGLERKSLRHRGARANMTLRVVSPSSMLLSSVENRAADLLRIASYVYAVDQSISRGGEVDVHGDDWKRDLTLLIPVSDSNFWNQEAICERLREVLNFASGDYWKFHFGEISPEHVQLPFEMDSSSTLGDPDSVHMFSGGLDSLCAAVEAAEAMGKRPLLVGHSPAFNVKSRQHTLAQALRQRFKGRWQYPYIGAPIHRMGSDASDYSQRTRGFLFAALGAIIADRLGLKEVCLADNGVVSLNLPINDQLLLARATRSTHPKFVRLFNEFSSLVLSNAPKVLNPLWARTRTEAIDVLKNTDAAELIEETHSCSHGRYLTNMQPHCGVCSQCIDRRFAILAAGLGKYDPPERYKVDIFRQAIDQWKGRTMALSYVRFGTEIGRLDELGLFHRFPDLYECVDPGDPDSRHVAQVYVELLRRHAASITRVMEEQISLARTEIVQEALPSTCLIRLLAGSGEARTDLSGDLHAEEQYSLKRQGDFWVISFEGRQSIIKHSQGLAYIARLLASPNEEIHVLTFAMGANRAAPTQASAYQKMSEDELAEYGLSVSELGDAGEVLDDEAKKAYKERLREIDKELGQAEEYNDQGRIAQLREEKESLVQELSAAVGLGGRNRKAASALDRARTAVRNSIARAIKHIGEQDKQLARFLTNSIKTGNICVYSPDKEVPWNLNSIETLNP